MQEERRRGRMSGFVASGGGAQLARVARVCEQRRCSVVARAEGDGLGNAGRKIAAGALGGLAAILGGMIGGANLRSMLPPVAPALAGTPYKYKTLGDKLAQVPVFLVTNASNQPYLANMEENHQVGLFFFSPEDASKMLQQMKGSSGGEDARILAMTLDKAIEMVRAKPSPSGLKGQNGQDLYMVFRLYPDSTEVKNAGRVLGRRGGASSQVPVFVVQGLVVRKGRETVQPLFFSKEDLDSCWNRLRADDPNLPRQPSVEVYGLQEIVDRMEESDDSLSEWGFFPSSKSVDFTKQLKNKKSTSARMHMNPM
mmetsp:Transcript_6515/g.19772  ORF Transcript_6515/g.19772 Transcript_6515/m.19772 type:complete len:311 (+) Transcript_6515:168-1100(+)